MVVPVVTVRADTVAVRVDSVVRARRAVPQAASTPSSVASSVVDSAVAVVVPLLRPRRTVDGMSPLIPVLLSLPVPNGRLGLRTPTPWLLSIMEAGKKNDDAKCGIAWLMLG